MLFIVPFVQRMWYWQLKSLFIDDFPFYKTAYGFLLVIIINRGMLPAELINSARLHRKNNFAAIFF